MKTKFIEAQSPQGNWGKFMVGTFDVEEWQRPSVFGGENYTLLMQIGMSPLSLLVVDLQTCEGAIFNHTIYRENATRDLNTKHQIWVCVLFEEFLGWLYENYTGDIDLLPSSVTLDVPFAFSGYRRSGHHVQE
jgi:hypothetical protein